ncbi:hypothetical protein [uncultured Desulfobulbus sp.]|nr:hypothetical protein [uncultured Desulfobulbus sp.]
MMWLADGPFFSWILALTKQPLSKSWIGNILSEAEVILALSLDDARPTA